MIPLYISETTGPISVLFTSLSYHLQWEGWLSFLGRLYAILPLGREGSVRSTEVVVVGYVCGRPISIWTQPSSGGRKKMTIKGGWWPCWLTCTVVWRCRASSLLICWRYSKTSVGYSLCTIERNGRVNSILRRVFGRRESYLLGGRTLNVFVCALPRGLAVIVFFQIGCSSFKCCFC